MWHVRAKPVDHTLISAMDLNLQPMAEWILEYDAVQYIYDVRAQCSYDKRQLYDSDMRHRLPF